MKQSVNKKVGEMSFAVAFLHFPILFSKGSCIIFRRKAFSIILQYFYLITTLSDSASAPFTATQALIPNGRAYFPAFFIVLL